MDTHLMKTRPLEKISMRWVEHVFTGLTKIQLAVQIVARNENLRVRFKFEFENFFISSYSNYKQRPRYINL